MTVALLNKSVAWIKASDKGCDRAVRSYNEGLLVGDMGYADRLKMVAGEWTGHMWWRKMTKRKA